MIFPDDSILEIEAIAPSDVEEAEERKLLDVGFMGIAGKVDAEAVRHFLDKNNPHVDGLMNVSGDMADAEKWPFVQGHAIALHGRPVFYEDIEWPDVRDWFIKTDETDSVTGRYLGDVVSGAVVCFALRHAICLAGDMAGEAGNVLYYGTDSQGQLGWHYCTWGRRTRANN